MTTTASQEYGVGVHCHHERLIEIVQGYGERVAYIRQDKPRKEQATRLRLLAIFPDERLPEAVRVAVVAAREAWAKRKPLYDDCQAKLRVLYDDYQAKRKALDNVIAEHMPALVALHDELCVECPWDEKQQTIFPTKVTP